MVMIIKRAACLAFTAACLTGIALLPAAHAQNHSTDNPGGNSVGTWGPNPGGPNLTPYTGGAPGANGGYGAYYSGPGGTQGLQNQVNPYAYPPVQTAVPGTYSQGTYGTSTWGNGGTSAGTYGATEPSYPMAPSAAGTSTSGFETIPAQPPGWSPARNVAESEHYTQLLQHNRGFREARMRKECGPITDPQLHQQCLASFAEYSPWAGTASNYGSSASSRRYNSSYGR
jgi:hypothetical protein